MVHQVDTGAPVLAWLVLALIHLVLAVDTLVPWDALPGTDRRIRNMGPSLETDHEQMRSGTIP